VQRLGAIRWGTFSAKLIRQKWGTGLDVGHPIFGQNPQQRYSRVDLKMLRGEIPHKKVGAAAGNLPIV